MDELQSHHCMTPEKSTWLVYSVSVMAANKLQLQILSESIGIKLLTSGFVEIFVS